MPAERDHVEDLNAILDALAESVAEESDDQLLAEVRSLVRTRTLSWPT